MIPVILSGGSGTRLWPLSRPLYPKQFLALHGENTLFQDTLLRVAEAGLSEAIVVSNEDHRFIVEENAAQIDQRLKAIILEPAARNTAPAIAVAALKALEEDKEAILMVLPADHIIEDVHTFAKAAKTAETLAKKGLLVTFGIKPTEPHTGYGYIETGDDIDKGVSFKLSSFKEKPDLKTAEGFIKDGNYLWNSGMFCFKAATYLEELKVHEPEIAKFALESLADSHEDLGFIRLGQESFSRCPDISIDYAVMEHTHNGAVVSLDAHWSDIGSWDAVWKASKKDEDGNVSHGQTMIRETKNTYIHSEDRLVSVLGCEDLVIIDTQDALLVAKKDKVQDIKEIVAELKKANDSRAKHHRTVYRPWGHYDSICHGERDQVKRITVKPGAKLSIQKHFHRSEHWVVVKGTARVTKGEETIVLTENESVYLPLGIVHALENPGKIPLQIIEVQTGSYLGEDDIVRLEDRYGRA